MKKEYMTPETELIVLRMADVIITSQDGDPVENPDW